MSDTIKKSIVPANPANPKSNEPEAADALAPTEVLEAGELEEVAGGRMGTNVGACGNISC